VNEHTERIKAASQATETPESTGEAEPVEEQPLNDLHGAHDQNFGRAMMARRVKPGEVSAEAAGDLSSYFGQQIAFNQIISLGALKKSGNVYVSANGYSEGWDNCSDTPVRLFVRKDDGYVLTNKISTFSTPPARRLSRMTTHTRSRTRRHSRRTTAWPAASRGRLTRSVFPFIPARIC
jgi:hypothetical protein